MIDERLAKAYDSCVVDGMIVPLQDYILPQIRNMLEISISGFRFAKKTKDIKDADWNIVYKNYYDILHLLCEAFVRLDSVKISNHKCLFAYLCSKHPELEFDWDFFEKVRTKRNGASYYGSIVTRDDWKEVELQMELYIVHLIKVLEDRLPKLDDISV